MSTNNPHEAIWIEDGNWALTDGKVQNIEIVHKFGAGAVGTSFVPVARGLVYPTPQAASATTLRIKAGGDANDTAAGTGAREVTLEGLDATGTRITEAVATAGALASAVTSNSFIRLYRAYVSAAGSYATPISTGGSHDADITIENGAGGTDWATIDSTGIAKGQSEIGFYTVPLGFTAFIKSVVISVDSSKSADLVFVQRQNILESAAPYTAMRIVFELGGVSGEEIVQPADPFGPFPALTDIGFLGKVASSTAEVDVDFEIELIPDATRRDFIIR